MKTIKISAIENNRIIPFNEMHLVIDPILYAFNYYETNNCQLDYQDCTKTECDIVFFNEYNYYDFIYEQQQEKIKGNPIYIYMHTREFPEYGNINFVLNNERPKLYEYSISLYDDSETNCYFNEAICWEFYKIKYKYNERININNINKNKSFCCFCSSHYTDLRSNTIDIINKYKTVTCIGDVRRNIDQNQIEDIHEWANNKFKFFLSIENTLTSSNPSYISEKIRDGYLTNSIPIYLGCSSISKIFNPKSFIDINNCSDEEIINKIKEIDEHDDIYLDMLHEYPFVHKEIQAEYYEKMKKFILNALNI